MANEQKHTPGAVRVAQIIMGGKTRLLINTRYGRKTVEGLADLIDRQTAAPELLEALEAITLAAKIDCPQNDAWKNLLDSCYTAIAKAQGS